MSQKTKLLPKQNRENSMDIMSYFAELINSQLNNQIPKPIPENIEISDILDLSSKAQMQGLICMALIKLDLPPDIKKYLHSIVIESTMKSLTQMCTINDLSKRLEESGIKHQFLKGSILKNIYPQPVFREMGDVDIMIYGETVERTEEIVKKLGFVLEDTADHHVVYRKRPFAVLEIHWNLFSKKVDHNQFIYYNDSIKAKIKENTKYTYEFSPEDFYVYMISHMAKHFYETGCGIRNLVDLYFYNEKYKNQLKLDVIERELNQLGLVSFEKYMRQLAYVWLTKGTVDDFNKKLFAYMMDCGIYGKGENGVWGQIAKEAKNKKSISKIKVRRMYFFPSLSRMREYYPWLKHKAFLLPVAWIIRIIHGISKGEGVNRGRVVTTDSNEDMQNMLEIYGKLDLEFRKS